MVSTRNHPSTFPPPDLSPTKTATATASSTLTATRASPTKRSTRASSAMTDDSTTPDSQALSTTTSSRRRAPSSSVSTTWSHTPSQLTLLWMAVSLPLVIWDTGYMLGRPHTMEAGWLHWPMYVPYKLYATVDYVYGYPGLENGWGPAQAAANAVETLMYLGYVWLAFSRGRREERVPGRGAPTRALSFGRRRIVGREAGIAVLLGFATAVMTFWKTLLYWAIEFFNGFESIGHNNLWNLITLWVIPNGAWIVGSGYLMYIFGAEILQGLEIAAGLPYNKKDI